MLAPGSRQNASTDEPHGLRRFRRGKFSAQSRWTAGDPDQTSGFGQPHYSRDAIAQFEFVSGQFDATQGGSMGVQVNAVTKSGRQHFVGELLELLPGRQVRREGFVQNRVLPYSDQQFSVTRGGPIIKDRLHYFANYEYERQPQTFSYSSPYPAFNFDQNRHLHREEGRPASRLSDVATDAMSVRGNGFGSFNPTIRVTLAAQSDIHRTPSRRRGTATITSAR